MLKQFNEGRSRTLYCVATTLLPIKALKKLLDLAKKKVKEKGVEDGDLRSKTKILKELLSEVVSKLRIDLKLRKPSDLNK